MLAIYGECGICKLKERQTIQNQCIKALYRLPRLSSSTYLYNSKLLPIVETAKIERVINIHRMKKLLTKHNFTFFANIDVHGRVMRRHNDIHLFSHIQWIMMQILRCYVRQMSTIYFPVTWRNWHQLIHSEQESNSSLCEKVRSMKWCHPTITLIELNGWTAIILT